jgi:hypothetical protein
MPGSPEDSWAAIYGGVKLIFLAAPEKCTYAIHNKQKVVDLDVVAHQ